jgi:hypothetical protein
VAFELCVHAAADIDRLSCLLLYPDVRFVISISLLSSRVVEPVTFGLVQTELFCSIPRCFGCKDTINFCILQHKFKKCFVYSLDMTTFVA